MALRCGICGHESPDGSNFCEGCGVQLAGQAVATPPSPQPDPVSAFTPPPVPPFTPSNSGGYQKTVDQSALAAAQTPPPWVAPAPAVEPAPAPAPAPVPATDPLVAPAPAPAPAPVVPAPQAPALPAGTLLIKRFGAVTQDQIPLLGVRLVVGRFDPSSGPVDIDVTGLPGAEHVSRRHAELFAEGGAWKVRDLGSSNGVYLKRAGESAYQPRLQEVAELHDGDEIAFGNTQFVFRGV